MAANRRDNTPGTAAELVHTARTRRRMSQRDLADAAAVPQSTVSTVESGRRQPTVAMLERLLAAAGFRLETRLANTTCPSTLLDNHHDEVAEVIARYPVVRAWLFGSVAAGDDRPDSDLDLLVELAPDTAFVDYVDLAEDLTAVLGCPVDVVTTNSSRMTCSGAG